MDVPNYKDWQYIPFSKSEARAVERVIDFLKNYMTKIRLPKSVRDSIEFEFAKATLVIDEESALRGAFHRMSGGKPFYRLQVSGNGREAGKLVFAMSDILSLEEGCDMALGPSTMLTYDFRGDLNKKSLYLANVIAEASRMIKPKNSGPTPHV